MADSAVSVVSGASQDTSAHGTDEASVVSAVGVVNGSADSAETGDATGPANTAPRVAFFPDSFHEINGVAHTSRQFEAFARQHNLPFLCVRAGNRKAALVEEGNLWTLELPRGFLSFSIEKDLRFDPAFVRHLPLIGDVLERFQPDLIHITGPSEMGLLGAAFAHELRLPLAASWHTNVHEYAATRSDWFLRALPERSAAATGKAIEHASLAMLAVFYSWAQVLFAPNRGLCAKLENATRRPCFLMPRGVDAQIFNPAKRRREATDSQAVLGYVGRLSIEKNVALLARVQEELERTIGPTFRFRIVGHGAEENWLRERLPRAEFTGVLKGEALAEAYAGMDLFVFPSHTDTFGNVVLEALASGVPAIVTPNGGPAGIVWDENTGRVVPDEDFAPAIAALLGDAQQLASMRAAARAYALTASWDSVFSDIYARYAELVPEARKRVLNASNTRPS